MCIITNHSYFLHLTFSFPLGLNSTLMKHTPFFFFWTCLFHILGTRGRRQISHDSPDDWNQEAINRYKRRFLIGIVSHGYGSRKVSWPAFCRLKTKKARGVIQSWSKGPRAGPGREQGELFAWVLIGAWRPKNQKCPWPRAGGAGRLRSSCVNQPLLCFFALPPLLHPVHQFKC